MKLSLPSLALACMAFAAPLAAVADQAAPPAFDPLQTFAPFAMPQPANVYRSASGRPGPAYWQNRADYSIKATLDPQRRQLSGEVTIAYTNHSPDALDALWLQLDENHYREDARANFTSGHHPIEHTGGYQLADVAVDTGHGFQPAHYVVDDTRMRLDLPQPLAAKDGTVKLRIRYSYIVPPTRTGRTDWLATKNGDLFEMAQWYPRMAVYDDLRGWDTAPYLNSEFYLEYGDIDYAVTVPADMIVVGSGELVNPQEVLTKTELARLEQARHSDATVLIRTPAEVTDPASRPHGGPLTWRFRMRNTRDVAFGASKAYVWDAARINLPSGKTAMAMSAYPVESVGQQGWSRSTEYLKHSVEHFSQRYLEYPYPNAIAEAGTVGGMEYPGIVFDSYKSTGKDFYALTAHEIGHTWFPMIVGSNERRDAWIDEGFNTFIDVYAADAFNHGEFSPKRDPEYAPKGGNPVDEIQAVLDDPEAPPLLTPADQIKEKYRHPVTYFKSALGLVLLREQILGPDRFDPAFRAFVHDWAYKHPSPSDFFRSMDSAAGEDLSWFWRGWYANNWKLDLAVTGVGYVDGDYRKGALVTVQNLDKLVLPAILQLTYADGSTRRVRVPVETWLQHRSFDVRVPGDKAVREAVIDPDHVLPDGHRDNNRFAPR
ncbi:M1 family metallopeptidase [Frateuria defendens]|uniref:M1 family metallopeptidase n=1 Tax=Frateuria defendens TaxID=2219559 RepID=UPI000AA9AA0C|nr:M1 family metallopeptidase [Frateuria defendens]